MRWARHEQFGSISGGPVDAWVARKVPGRRPEQPDQLSRQSLRKGIGLSSFINQLSATGLFFSKFLACSNA